MQEKQLSLFKEEKPVFHYVCRYVCFDDSPKDPTYCESSSLVYLVMSEAGSEAQNPCADESAKFCPLHPLQPSDVELFAEFHGFKVVNLDGVLHLNTGIKPK